MNTICINCPVGCKLTIEEKNGEIIVTGNGCLRGVTYGKSEFTKPVRVVTSLIKIGGYLYSVKTSIAVDKTKIFDVLKAISELNNSGEYDIGDIICKNIIDSGADIVVTGKNSVQDYQHE